MTPAQFQVIYRSVTSIINGLVSEDENRRVVQKLIDNGWAQVSKEDGGIVVGITQKGFDDCLASRHLPALSRDRLTFTNRWNHRRKLLYPDGTA